MNLTHITDSPYFEPGMLALIGAVSLVLWIVSARHLPRFRVLKISVSLFALALSLYLFVDRSERFWGAHYDHQSRELVLHRLAARSDLRVSVDNLDTVTMVRIAERTLFGSRDAVRFIVGTTGGEYYDSGPQYRDNWQEMAQAMRVAVDNRSADAPTVRLPQL